jgi:hypothetical protein
MGTTISGGGGPQYTPIENTPPITPVNKPQEKVQDPQQNTCNVPQVNKKEDVPYPLFSGIEKQLDESFEKFKGSIKEAKEKSNIVFNQDSSGSETGLISNQITSKAQFINNSFKVEVEGNFVVNGSPVFGNESSNPNNSSILPSQTKVIPN